MKLYDLARIIRSKNAGPFTLTIDLIFSSQTDLDRVLHSPQFTHEGIAQRYFTEASGVGIHTLKPALAIKITLPRNIPSGSIGDLDVYGSQQHMPLAEMDI